MIFREFEKCDRERLKRLSQERRTNKSLKGTSARDGWEENSALLCVSSRDVWLIDWTSLSCVVESAISISGVLDCFYRKHEDARAFHEFVYGSLFGIYMLNMIGNDQWYNVNLLARKWTSKKSLRFSWDLSGWGRQTPFLRGKSDLVFGDVTKHRIEWDAYNRPEWHHRWGLLPVNSPEFFGISEFVPNFYESMLRTVLCERDENVHKIE